VVPTSAREPTSPTTPAARRWFAASLGLAVAMLVAIGAFNAYVDPFQQYRIPGPFPARYYTSLHRYIAPGLAKNAVYDTLLSGSSIVENTRNSAIGRACHGVGLNVAMPALTASEQAQIVATALAAKPLARAILVLDFNEFSGAPDQRNPLAGPMPAYFYDRNPLNDFPYLLSWGVLVKSWRMLMGDRTERFRTEADAPWWWADEKRFARDEVVKRLDPRNLNAQFQQPPRELAGMQESLRRNLLPLFTTYPRTEFVLVWPPYSIVVWADFVQRGQLDVSLDFKRWVFEATRALPNVRVIDLQGVAKITHDLDRYTDLYHFEPAVNEWLVEEACGERYRVRPDTVDTLDRELRRQAQAFDPASLAGK
jgi:hypothetical protein